MKNYARHAILLCAACLAPGCKRYFINYSDKPRADINAIVNCLADYAIRNNGHYPSSLVPLVTPDANGQCYLNGYDGKVPKDPWKHEYQYEPPTPEHPKPHVWSWGADGKPGGTGDAADIHDDDHAQPKR